MEDHLPFFLVGRGLRPVRAIAFERHPGQRITARGLLQGLRSQRNHTQAWVRPLCRRPIEFDRRVRLSREYAHERLTAAGIATVAPDYSINLLCRHASLPDYAT